MRPQTIQRLSLALFLLLFLWGTWSFLAFLGTRYHTFLLLSEEQHAAVQQSCTALEQSCSSVPAALEGSCQALTHVCRGARALPLAISHTFGRSLLTFASEWSHLGPFFWYLLYSALIIGAIFVWKRWYRGSSGPITMRPWYLAAGFAVLLWVLMMSMSNNIVGTFPLRIVTEPRPEIYVNPNPRSLALTQENFNQLQERGCLHFYSLADIGSTRTSLYKYSLVCVQISFAQKVMGPLLLLFLLTYVVAVAGRMILRRIISSTQTLFTEFLLSVGLGIGVLIALLWVLAVAGLYNSYAGWLLLAAVLAVGYRHAVYWWRTFASHTWQTDLLFRPGALTLFWLLCSLLAFNYLTVIRPFPIGWDDLGVYLNYPRLLVSYGHFIEQLSAFNWEYLSSLGYLLFGYDGAFSAVVAQLINWSAGAFAVGAILLFARRFIGMRSGLLAANLYYFLPMVGHFSFADMKIDNAVFAMGALSTFAMFVALFPVEEGDNGNGPAKRWLVLSGIFVGLTFAFKLTTVMLIMALILVLSGVVVHWLMALSILFLSLAVYIVRGVWKVGDFYERIFGQAPFTPTQTKWLLLVLAIVLGAIALRKALSQQRKQWGVSLGIFLVAAGLTIAPWILHNNYLIGNIIPRPALQAPEAITPYISDATYAPSDINPARDVRVLPEELALDQDHEACRGSSKEEELDRYWGHDGGLRHYLTLLWRTVMNDDQTGYYVVLTPLLLLFPLLFLLPAFWRKELRWLRWLVAATWYLIVQWILLANGVSWYGIAIFLGLVIGLEAWNRNTPDLPNKILLQIFVSLGLLFLVSFRMSQYPVHAGGLRFLMGISNEDLIQHYSMSYYKDIVALIVQRHETMPDRPYVYRNGTFIPYFIPKNTEIIGIKDDQMDFFNCLYQEGDAQLTLQRFQALGFNSMVIDRNMTSIEDDPEGSLHKKAERFQEFVSTPDLGITLTVRDPNVGIEYILLP